MKRLLAAFCQWMADSDRGAAECVMRASGLAFIRRDYANQSIFLEDAKDLHMSADRWEARARRFTP